MNQNYWLIILFVATMVCNDVNCRPREVDLTNFHPVYKSNKVEREALSSSVSSEDPDLKFKNNGTGQKFNIEAIATVARASNNGPEAQPSAVIDHLVDSVSQMVESDIRTPPKLKEILKEKNTDKEKERVTGIGFKPMPVTFVYEDDDAKLEEISFVGTEKVLQTDVSVGKASATANSKITANEGLKGVAIPVLMDDGDETTKPVKKLQKISETIKPAKDERKQNVITKFQFTTTPSSGLSTWILLSDNRDSTTPTSVKNNKKNFEDKKTQVGAQSTTRKPIKIQSTTAKNGVTLKKNSSKLGTRKPESEPTSALKALVETQKKGIMTSTTSKPPKTSESRPSGQRKPQTDSKKKFSEKSDVSEIKERVGATTSDAKVVQTIPPHFVLPTSDPTIAEDQNNAVTENVVEGTTKKKKSNTKKKKNKKKKKKPETEIEPKNPPQPVGSQIYNFLSREIVPTVGLGLIGVALTAGLASFLGYNPFVSSAIPLRRTYETSHGYSPSNYYNYNYNTDYSGGGQSEEILLREVLMGMPEESRYGLTHGDSMYSDTYNRNDRIKSPVYSTQTETTYNSDNKDSSSYDSSYSQDYSRGSAYDVSNKKFNKEYDEKYPVYTRETGTSFVYPETPAMTLDVKSAGQAIDPSTQAIKSEKFTKTKAETIERQPEAIYRVAMDEKLQYRSGESAPHGINSQNNWHRMGTPMDSPTPISSRVEPEPRSLNLSKIFETDSKRRTKRDASDFIQRIARKRTKKETDAENEIDVGDSVKDHQKEDDDNLTVYFPNTQTATSWPATVIESSTTTTDPTKYYYSRESSTSDFGNKGTVDSTEDKKEDDSSVPFPIDDDTGSGSVSNASFLDILKRLAQFKLRLGLNFLRSTTDMFSRYLDVIQRKVDESLSNTTTVQYNKRKSPWSRIFFGRNSDNFLRKKRSALQVSPLLTTLLTEEGYLHNDASKSTKKDLKMSDKMFFTKKSVPKKYLPKIGQ